MSWKEGHFIYLMDYVTCLGKYLIHSLFGISVIIRKLTCLGVLFRKHVSCKIIFFIWGQ